MRAALLRRLVSFFAVVLGLLLGLELVARAFPDQLAAVSHRVHFKLALLRAKGAVDFVVVGSSRTNDGVSPPRLGLGAGFSSATPSSSLPTLEYFATHLGPQKLVLVEVSTPQAVPGDDLADGPSLAPHPPTPGDPLGDWLDAHSALLQVRRALAVENLPRFFALTFSSLFDGSEWLRTRFLVQFLASDAPPPGIADDAAWVPELPPPGALEDADAERVLAGYARVVEALRRDGARVVLMGPPLGAGWRAEECTPARRALRAEVARRTGAPLLDFTCREVDERWFVEGQLGAGPRALVEGAGGGRACSSIAPPS